MRCSEPGRGVAVAIVAEQHIPPEPRAARFGILGVIRHVRDDARPGFQILRFEQDGSVTAETVRC